MNTPHPSSDPLFRSLAGEAPDLPVRAAIEARRRIARRRRNRQRSALVATASLIGIITWGAMSSAPESIPSSSGSGTIAVNPPVEPPVLQTPPSQLDPEQMALVQAAGDMPLLLVRNSSGQVTRIHLIER